MRPTAWSTARQVYSHIPVRRSTATTSSRCHCDKIKAHRSVQVRRRCYASQPISPLHDIREKSKHGPLVFCSTSSDPYHNLSIEHYLLTNSDHDSNVLFFYTNRPCVVIGRNQNPWVECALRLLQKGFRKDNRDEPIDLVRRRSGGGAVFHDSGNLNFSTIVPNDKNFSRRKHAEMIVRALQSIPASLAQSALFDHIFVNDRHDITIQRKDDGKQYKASGSAFKLTRGRALHHGTLLHSSPNLGSISKVLRSPGRDYIQAKGVESVRSPVSNLFAVTDVERDETRKTIIQAIVAEFALLYGQAADVIEVGDRDYEIAEIAAGSKELKTLEWQFGQTPRFQFTSLNVRDKQVVLSVNRGIIEEGLESVLGLSLYDIQQWSSAIESENLPEELVKQLAETFPATSSLGGKGHITKTAILRRNDENLVRQLEDGSLEIEKPGQNILEQKSTAVSP